MRKPAPPHAEHRVRAQRRRSSAPRRAACCGLLLAAALAPGGCALTELLTGAADAATEEDAASAAAPAPAPEAAEATGTGPGHTLPAAQGQEVSWQGLPGAVPRHEPIVHPQMYRYQVRGRCYEVWHGRTSYSETGLAAWYGPGFDGRPTASGERFDRRGFTAAHRNLPLPSFLKVTNLDNGRALVVRVNDRGPFTPGRIIDLAEGAARALGITGRGEARVHLEYIDVHNNTQPPLPPGSPRGCPR